MMKNYSVVIQAGGESRRMGQDKGLLPFGDGFMVNYILRQIDGMGEECFIISNHPDNYYRFGLSVYPDVIPGIGALGGVYTALFYAKTDYVILLACDMPFINKSLLTFLISSSKDFEVVIPRVGKDKLPEPFRAVYAKRCLTYVEETIHEGKRRVIDFFDQAKIRYVDQDEIEKYDPDGLSFFNVNTQKDLLVASRMAGFDVQDND